MIQAVTTLLDATKSLLAIEMRENRRESRRANIFRALGLQRSELDHSRTLGYLLNPSAAHDQGALFLESFLLANGIQPPSECEEAEVLTEVPIGKFGQLDLLVKVKRTLIVCIENKVDAVDQDNQVRRYLAWLSDRNPEAAQAAVIYLTPSGREPSAVIDDPRLLLFSYGQVARWLRQLKIPPRLAAVVMMYCEVCEELNRGPEMTVESDQLTAHLSEPANLPTALEIYTHVDALRKKILNDFWSNVQRCTEANLRSSPGTGQWRFKMTPDQCWILPLRHSEKGWKASASRRTVCISAQALTGRTYFGIWKSYAYAVPIDLSGPIVENLRSAGYATSKNKDWLGWRYGDGLGLPENSGSAQGLLRLDRDNRETSNPLARRLGDELSRLVVANSDYLERLDAISEGIVSEGHSD